VQEDLNEVMRDVVESTLVIAKQHEVQ
jgi:hypothetical protein